MVQSNGLNITSFLSNNNIKVDKTINKPNAIFRHFDFFLIDIICTTLAFYGGLFIRHGIVASGIFSMYTMLFIFMLVVEAMACVALNVYHKIIIRGYFEELKKVFTIDAVVLATTVIFLFFQKKSEDYSRLTLAYFSIIYFFITYISHLIVKRFHRNNLLKGKNARFLLLVSSYEQINDTVNKLTKEKFNPLRLVAIAVTDSPEHVGESVRGIPIIAHVSTVLDYVKNNVVDDVFINETNQMRNEIVDQFLDMGITVNIGLEDMMEFPNAGFDSVSGYKVITTSISPITFYQKIIKRAVDILFGLLGSVCTVILTICLAPFIYFSDRGPIFYKQERVGLNGRKFNIWKFRSMYVDADQKKADLLDQNEVSGFMFKMENDPRIIGSGPDGTKHGVGHFIRKHSLDEFPQFFNVLAGQMSLVGTRPPTVEETSHYGAKHLSRLALKPGLTGLWQVSGRSDITDFEEVVKLDNEYIRNFSIKNDARIIFKTFSVVLTGKGSE